MKLKDRGAEIPILLDCKLSHATHRDHTLHPIFTHESTDVYIVKLNVTFRSIDIPLMDVSKRIVAWCLGGWRGRPVETVWVCNLEHLRDSFVNEEFVVPPIE